MNHRPSAKAADVDSTGLFSQVVTKALQPGDEVFTNYGSMPLELSFTNYGFATAEMAINMGPAFRDLMEQSLNDPEMMVHGPKHAEIVAKQLLAKRCHGIDIASHGGVVGWGLLKRVLQCTRILFLSPDALEMMILREIQEPKITMRPFDFESEIK